MAARVRKQTDPPTRPYLRPRPRWRSPIALLDDAERWNKTHLLRYVPAALFGWFGIAWVDVNVLALAAIMGIGAAWYNRRPALREELPEEDDDLL